MIWSCLDDVHVTSFFLCPVSKRHQIDANVFLRKKTLRKGTRHPNSGMGHSQIGKMKGNVAYRGDQSFRPDELTPETCHEIGIETARRMWPDYEAIIDENTGCGYRSFGRKNADRPQPEESAYFRLDLLPGLRCEVAFQRSQESVILRISSGIMKQSSFICFPAKRRQRKKQSLAQCGSA